MTRALVDGAGPATGVAALAVPLVAGGADAPVQRYLDAHARFAASRPAGESAWLADLRRTAIDRFRAIGFPTVRDEDWRFTNVATLAATPYVRAERGAGRVLPSDIDRYRLADARHLVFVDGHFAPELSDPELVAAGGAPGVEAGPLAAALAARSDDVAPWLGRHVRFDRQPFVALNTAFLDDGAFVRVPRGLAVEAPIHLLFVASGARGRDGSGARGRDGSGPGPTVAFPRNVITIEAGAQATIVETYTGPGSEEYFTCGVTEIAVGPGAVVDHYKLQDEGRAAHHMATLQVVQARDSAFSSHSISTGGRLVRYDVNAFLDGEGVDCTLNGLYIAGGDQHVDHHMWVEHAQAHGTSREVFKGILDDRARAVFNGRIYVHRGAQATDAKQSNRNLLLSDRALVNSNPQLEIFADDVRCTHGSTVGQIDAEAVFYLRSRGIGEAAARSILVYAFAADILTGIRLDAVRERLENHLYARLPHGDVVRQAV